IFVAQPGSLMVSRLSGAPALPVTASFDRCWTLRSWDRMVIPKPFCRGVVIYGQPVSLTPGGGREEMELKIKELERTLLNITQQADGYFGKS
ncbi:MAG: hypothetical protein OEV92_07485, partial [Nitrospinota bacterium]|nr:hypothetical protein [Nitrospinota bacterium]